MSPGHNMLILRISGPFSWSSQGSREGKVLTLPILTLHQGSSCSPCKRYKLCS